MAILNAPLEEIMCQLETDVITTAAGLVYLNKSNLGSIALAHTHGSKFTKKWLGKKKHKHKVRDIWSNYKAERYIQRQLSAFDRVFGHEREIKVNGKTYVHYQIGLTFITLLIPELAFTINIRIAMEREIVSGARAMEDLAAIDTHMSAQTAAHIEDLTARLALANIALEHTNDHLNEVIDESEHKTTEDIKVALSVVAGLSCADAARAANNPSAVVSEHMTRLEMPYFNMASFPIGHEASMGIINTATEQVNEQVEHESQMSLDWIETTHGELSPEERMNERTRCLTDIEHRAVTMKERLVCEAVSDIFDVKLSLVESELEDKMCFVNRIRLYAKICRFMKSRLPTGTMYSTEMPYAHVYTYARNYNQFMRPYGRLGTGLEGYLKFLLPDVQPCMFQTITESYDTIQKKRKRRD
jgi:hypothetical protein